MTVVIATPVWNHPDLTEDFILRYLHNTDFTAYDVRLVIADDGSKETTRDMLRRYAEQYPDKLTVVFREQNGGFSAATNSAINAVDADYYVALSNDVQCLNESWLRRLIEPMQEKKCITGGQYINYNSITFVDGSIVDYLGGWCIAMPKQLVNDLKAMQNGETFLEMFGTGYFEDVMLSFIAKHVFGYELVAPADLPLNHIGGQTLNETVTTISALTQRNQQLFRDHIRLLAMKHRINLAELVK